MWFRLVVFLATSAGTAMAQDANVKDGRDLFLYFCAECHGKDAASVGPMAEMLAIEPPDLTVLSERNAGEFPVEFVATQVDGRKPTEVHSFMPVFGSSLDTDQHVAIALPSGQPMLVSRHLADLMAYLQT
ncbi:MAG: c-type cytochrome, partial [Pseudomonadota bacterium]